MQSEGRRKRRALLGLAAYAAFALAALAWFTFFSFPGTQVDAPHSADSTGPVDHYAGSVLIPVGSGNRCRQLAFDNNSGNLQEVGVSSCQQSVPGTNSTEGRMKAIRNSFAGK